MIDKPVQIPFIGLIRGFNEKLFCLTFQDGYAVAENFAGAIFPHAIPVGFAGENAVDAGEAKL